jgi:hypothetical protein
MIKGSTHLSERFKEESEICLSPRVCLAGLLSSLGSLRVLVLSVLSVLEGWLRLSTLTTPCSLQHQQQVAQAVERAKQVTMTELNAIIGVRGLASLPLTVCIALLLLSLSMTRDRS